MTPSPDNIAAIATAPGRGGIGVVRISGHELEAVAIAITGRKPTPRFASYTPFLSASNEVLDQGISLFFSAPHSYTGEDVLELHGHGGPAVLQSVLLRCLELGVRLALPGEFTQRAYLNNKIDLAQAESVSDLIEATTQQAARSAVRSLQGDFSNTIRGLVHKLIDLRMLIEASLDFPEDETIGLPKRWQIVDRLNTIRSEIIQVEGLAKQGSILREGAQVVLVGAPNVGKSSLLNKLAGEDISIVSEVAGTTRDSIHQALQIKGVPLHIIDTAGLRETSDVVERLGISRTQLQIERADLVLILKDDSSPTSLYEDSTIFERIPHSIQRLFVHNKIDLSGRQPSVEVQGDSTHLYVSAKNGWGIDLLQEEILGTIGWHNEAGVFMARTRHLSALAHANNHLQSATQQLNALELLAEELRQAQGALNQITGEFVADDLLGEIFSRFCIGK